ncbi:MAG: glutamate synthase [bacterium]|nr:MAG: glutamate synthase [bacterium]
MIKTTILEPGQTDVIHIKKYSPEEIVVVDGASWKCPVYVRRLPPCRDACPSSEDIRGYLTQVAQTDLYGQPLDESLDEAWYILTDKNPMPATHGRICPHPCEEGCNRQHKADGSVAINNFERFIGDHGLKRGLKLKKLTDEKKDKPIAVIGSGPSGLSCAYQMARRGYQVTIFETFEKPGGMLRYGIPEYRLPEDILDGEIQNILDLGIELKCNIRVGKDIDFEKIQKDYAAVYVAIGAHKGVTLGVAGEDSANVFTAASYLNRIKTGAKVEIGKKVLVIGGGDSAVDAARVSLRLAAGEAKVAIDSARVTKRLDESSEVTIVYRRTRDEMPAIKQDVDEAIHEGIKIEFLVAPKEFVIEGGRAVGLTCTRMELGEPDSSGRRRPVPIEGSEFTIDSDMIIVGIGQAPELPGGLSAIADDRGWIKANENKETKVAGVYAGGDALELGISTKSVGEGREAAQAIEAYLKGTIYKKGPEFMRPIKQTELRMDYYESAPRNKEESLAPEERIHGFDEVNKTITQDQAVAEAKRCMSCGLCFACDQCRVFCPREAISRSLTRPKGKTMFTDYTKCNGCHVCYQACPSGYIQMGMGL